MEVEVGCFAETVVRGLEMESGAPPEEPVRIASLPPPVRSKSLKGKALSELFP